MLGVGPRQRGPNLDAARAMPLKISQECTFALIVSPSRYDQGTVCLVHAVEGLRRNSWPRLLQRTNSARRRALLQS